MIAPMARPLTFASFLAPNGWPAYEFIAREVGARHGREGRLIVGSSFDQFDSGEVDAAFICSPPFLRLAARGLVEAIAAPVPLGTRYGGRPIYFSDVVVRTDSHVRDFEDLAGCRFSFNDVDSYSGYIAPLFHLNQLGKDPGFFGSWLESGSHQESIRMILAGEADAAAIDSLVLAIESRRAGVATGLRTIAVLGPAPIQPVVIASRLPASSRQRIRALLLDLHSNPVAREALAAGMIERFVTVNRATYAPVRARLDALAPRTETCVVGTSPARPFQSIGL